MQQENAGHVLQTSAQINEAYFGLCRLATDPVRKPRPFSGIDARVMRRILVDDARKRDSAWGQSDP